MPSDVGDLLAKWLKHAERWMAQQANGPPTSTGDNMCAPVEASRPTTTASEPAEAEGAPNDKSLHHLSRPPGGKRPAPREVDAAPAKKRPNGAKQGFSTPSTPPALLQVKAPVKTACATVATSHGTVVPACPRCCDAHDVSTGVGWGEGGKRRKFKCAKVGCIGMKWHQSEPGPRHPRHKPSAYPRRTLGVRLGPSELFFVRTALTEA